MKKILLVSCNSLANGGVQAVIMNIVRSLCKEYVFDVLLSSDDYNYHVDEFLKYGGKIFRIYDYPGKNNFLRRCDVLFRSLWRINQIKNLLVKNGPYDVIHCNNELEAGMCLEAAYRVGVPVRIAHFHTVEQTKNIVRKKLNSFYRNKVLKYATSIIGCSEESLVSRNLNNSGIVLNNPYDNQRFPGSENLDNIRPFSIVQIGSYSDNKNQLYTLSLLKCIKRKYSNIKLSFIGFPLEDKYFEKLQDFVKLNGLENDVAFYPCDADAAKLLDGASYFIMPSKAEGFGLVLVEAQAMGCRCYVSDTVPKSTNCGGCEYFSLNDDIQQLANKMIANYEQYQGRHFFFDCSQFARENVAKKYREIYG